MKGFLKTWNFAKEINISKTIFAVQVKSDLLPTSSCSWVVIEAAGHLGIKVLSPHPASTDVPAAKIKALQPYVGISQRHTPTHLVCHEGTTKNFFIHIFTYILYKIQILITCVVKVAKVNPEFNNFTLVYHQSRTLLFLNKVCFSNASGSSPQEVVGEHIGSRVTATPTIQVPLHPRATEKVISRQRYIITLVFIPQFVLSQSNIFWFVRNVCVRELSFGLKNLKITGETVEFAQ